MKKLIFVTVGTSALFGKCNGLNWEHSANRQIHPTQEHLCRKLDEDDINNRTDEFNHQKEGAISTIKKSLIRYYENRETGLIDLSAELASLLAMEKDSAIGPIASDDVIYLLHSDTADSRLCAEINEVLFKEDVVIEKSASKLPWNIQEPIKIEKLNAVNVFDFQNEGLENYQKKIINLSKDFNGRVLLNVTGGYKALIPFGTLLAFQNEFTIFYLFEQCNEIVYLDSAYFDERFGAPNVKMKSLAPGSSGRRSAE
ncbi:putative CRISPR-associated protein [candidate division KSB1 bacterium]|nr:putative CRISPR-associated protein [candidate division KSB1 bacterium]